MSELLSLGLSLESVIHDYKLVADSITDDDSFQTADWGLVVSNLSDVIGWLEELKVLRMTDKECLYRNAYNKGRTDAIEECREVLEQLKEQNNV